MTDNENRVLNLIRSAFQGVTLGKGIGLWQAEGLDAYADDQTVAAYRLKDEKNDWSILSVANLNRCGSSPCYFDTEGMRFHLPAFLIADLTEGLDQDFIYHLTHFEIQGVSKFELLSDAQRNAVREFLLLRLSDANYEFERPEIERALSEYWTTTQTP